VPRVRGKDFACPFETTGDQRRADFLPVHAEAKFRAGKKAERNADDGQPAVVVFEASCREFNFVGPVDVSNVFKVDDMILGVFVD
jgi:hypothetical protein